MAVDRLSVLAVDPGGTTGVAACNLEVKPTVKETFRDGLVSRREIEVAGGWFDQAVQLHAIHQNWVARSNEFGGERVVVIEDFLADPRRVGAGATNLTSVWVAAAWAGTVGAESEQWVWQPPAQAKGYATNDRLKLWGLWVVGSEHMRDAWRHVATLVNKRIP